MRLTLTKMTTALLILAATSSVALAQNYKDEYKGEETVAPKPAPCIIPCMLKDGLYAGAQVGYDSYRVRENFSIGAPPIFTVNPQISATGWVGGVLLGYGQYLNELFYVGAEVMANYSDANSSFTATAPAVSYNNQVRVRGSWGLAILPGIRLNDGALGYVRLGYNWANIHSHETAIVTNIASATANKSYNSSGFAFGVGIEALMYENWSVRAEYTYTNYSSFNSSFTTKFNPSDNQFMLAAIYHISC